MVDIAPGPGRTTFLGHPRTRDQEHFASSGRVNWWDTGWVRTLTEAGRRVITIDNRGHGASQKLYDPADYTAPGMAEDAKNLLDHLEIGQADVMGYSMGARIAAFLTINHPERVRRAVLGGLGDNYFAPPSFASAVPDALLADDPDTITDRGAKTFRVFADQQKQDRVALAACWRRPRLTLSDAELAAIRQPVLVICGEKDAVTGSPERLAASMPGAVLKIVPGRDHMTAVGDRVTKTEVLGFLGG